MCEQRVEEEEEKKMKRKAHTLQRQSDIGPL